MVVLDVSGLSKRFDGLEVLEDVRFHLSQGEARLLIGPNGAGKTTLLRALMGFTSIDTGAISFDGERIEKLPPYLRRQRGMVLVWQTPQPVPELTVEENLLLGALPGLGVGRSLFVRRYRPKLMASVRKTLKDIGLLQRADTLATNLTHAERKLLEIGCGLAHRPKLLLLDEPTAGLSESEAAHICELLLVLKQQTTMLIVVHDMAFARRLQVPLMFLHEGRILRHGTLDEIEQDPVIRDAYFGRTT